MTTIKVSRACKSYQSGSELNVVLNNFDMNVKQGTIYAMMGSSGCGKTTLISCLVGIKSLDSGDIEVFGEAPGFNKRRIGYMPQESALTNDFTVREMIWFYGKIYGLSSVTIDERFRFLSDLLELPDENRLLRDCSGGEQRRVSFALTLVHEPELLILDEPTVGVDPLLRNKIWDYLVEITSTKNVTVVLSTHYIDEAKQSTHIGVMRNGVQIAEDTPRNILRMTETNNLEEAFLKMSEKQERLTGGDSTFPKVFELPSIHETLKNFAITEKDPRPVYPIEPAKGRLFRGILLALVMKHFLKILRNIDLLIIALVMPLVGIASLHYGVGGQIRGLSIGIVNNEVNYTQECFNQSLVTTQVLNYNCQLNKLSCRFIKELNNDIALKKHYKTMEDALEAAKKAEIIGIIYFASNFSKSYALGRDFTEDDRSDFGTIQVHLDHTDSNFARIMSKKLLETYEKFSEKLMIDCGKARKAGNIPLIFESDFGIIDSDLRITLVPGFIISAFFTIASYITCTSIITSKVDGNWDRTIAAGVTPNHYVLSHLIEGLVIAMLQFLQYSFYSIFILSPATSVKSALILAMLLLFIALTGLTFGLLSSICFKSILVSFIFGQATAYPLSFVSGIMWPFEALPVFLQCVGYFFPLALSTSAFRNVLVKNADFSNITVLFAFANLTSWILVQLILCVWLVNKEDKVKPKLQKNKLKSRN